MLSSGNLFLYLSAKAVAAYDMMSVMAFTSDVSCKSHLPKTILLCVYNSIQSNLFLNNWINLKNVINFFRFV